MRYWKPEDIFTAACPFCQGEIEFWKDEPLRVCPSCRKEVRNPKQDFGCADWCRHSEECLPPEAGDRRLEEPKQAPNPEAPGGHA